MKVTRALLLSSKKQAEAWEGPSYRFLGIPMQTRQYQYLVTDCGEDGIIFDISRVSQESYVDEQGTPKKRTKISERPHVHEEFCDMSDLINFLRRYQIDFESAWQPVESE